MKTVAIVSFVDSENYGANLQAFALQEKLKDLGYKPTYINLSRPSHLTGFNKLKNRIWTPLRYLFGYADRLNKTRKFRNTYFSLSLNIKSEDELKNLPTFDFYIVGSDQVWNPRLLSTTFGFYFLSFAPKNSKKISYASSFGTNLIPHELDKKYYNYLSEFCRISVRENYGKDYLESIGIKSSVVLDPTLLLNQNKWLKFFDLESKIEKPYILCYVMTGDNNGAKYIRKISRMISRIEKSKYNIVVIGDKEYKKLMPNNQLITNAGVEDFLNYIYNASYVLTNSFHGTCFSLIFNKEFFSVLHKFNPLNSRITNLLESTELSDRIIYSDTDVSTINLSKIDFEKINKILNNLREESIKFLREALSDVSKVN